MNNTRTPDPQPGDDNSRDDIIANATPTAPLDVYLLGLRDMTVEDHASAWRSLTFEPSVNLAAAAQDYGIALAHLIDTLRAEDDLGFDSAVAYIVGTAKTVASFLPDGEALLGQAATALAAMPTADVDPVSSGDGIRDALEYALNGGETVRVILEDGGMFRGQVFARNGHDDMWTLQSGNAYVEFASSDVIAVRVEVER